MAAATINFRVQPFRLLTEGEAAHYCRTLPRKFRARCPVRPVQMPDGDRWDVLDLDAWIDALKAGRADDVNEIAGKLA